jgi:hypothetical protein
LHRVLFTVSGFKQPSDMSPPLAARCTRVLRKESAPRGRGECRVPSAPAASCAYGSGECTRVFTARSPEITRHSRTQWFHGLYVLSPEIGLSCLRRLRGLLRKLDASVEASGPHDLAVRGSSALVRSAARVHRILPRVRDDRDTPLMWDRTVVISEVIWVGGEQKYFCKKGWTVPKSVQREGRWK